MACTSPSSADHRRNWRVDHGAAHRFFTPPQGFLRFDPFGNIGAGTAVPDKLAILFENGFTAYRKPYVVLAFANADTQSFGRVFSLINRSKDLRMP